MADFKLYAFGESGNAYKVAFMLSACGLAWEPIPVDFFNGEARGAAYRQDVNEMGEVPVLLHGNRKIAQSGAILTYLAGLTGRFGGADEDERLQALAWILFDNHKFTGNLATLRFLVAMTKSGESPVTDFLRKRLLSAAAIIDKHLATRPFMVGEGPTIADFSLCGYMFHPEAYGVDWTQFTAIRGWLDRLAALPGWKPPYEMIARAPARRA
jgi:glutathione S-transferase